MCVLSLMHLIAHIYILLRYYYYVDGTYCRKVLYITCTHVNYTQFIIIILQITDYSCIHVMNACNTRATVGIMYNKIY